MKRCEQRLTRAQAEVGGHLHAIWMMHLSNADQTTLKATTILLGKFSHALSNAHSDLRRTWPAERGIQQK